MNKSNKTFMHLLLLAIGLLCISGQSFAQEMKVMTYNIYHGEQNYNRGKSNLQQIAEVINKYQPDFVALQEVDSMTARSASLHNDIPQDLVQELARMTGMHGFFGKAIEYDNGGYGEGILSRFPAQPASYKLPTPKGGEGRVLLTITHTFPNGQQIIFAGTHLCHQYDENRRAQAEAICEILRGTGLPMVMGGDFNFRPDTEPYQAITQYFKDAALMKGDPELTYSYANPSARIDYFFVSDNDHWVVKNVEVIHNNASDHMPVVVTLEWKE